MTHTIYITRNGLLEPLGQSQVLPYLRGLSDTYRITLLTREKGEDWYDAEAMQRQRDECERLGIDWRPRLFRPKPRFFGPLIDIAAMTHETLTLIREHGAVLIHARSYIPAAVAWWVRRRTCTPFIFDMRALWPEELVTAGRLKRGSAAHRLIAGAERRFLRDAAAVVSLTNVATNYLKKRFKFELSDTSVYVIPTCADLSRFSPAASRQTEPIVHACIGSILSGWFRIDWLAAWIRYAAGIDLSARFAVVTRDDPVAVRAALGLEDAVGQRLTVESKAPADMPIAVRSHSLSVMFYKATGLSDAGRSPTRMAEVLGSGLPVVANAGVGDVARIITENRVGVLVSSAADTDIAAAYAELQSLMEDPELAERCRKTAETLFSLEAGTATYRAIYSEIEIRKA